MTSDKKVSEKKQYDSIKDGEVRFSLLFKEFAGKGLLPNNYDYQKVREYLVKLKLIYLKEFKTSSVVRKITYVTDNALDKGILRIVGSKTQGNELIYNYVFTKNGVEYMEKIFSELDDQIKIDLFAQNSVA